MAVEKLFHYTGKLKDNKQCLGITLVSTKIQKTKTAPGSAVLRLGTFNLSSVPVTLTLSGIPRVIFLDILSFFLHSQPFELSIWSFFCTPSVFLMFPRTSF